MSSAEGLLLNVVTNYDKAMEMFVVEKATGEVIRRQMVQDSAQVHFDTNGMYRIYLVGRRADGARCRGENEAIKGKKMGVERNFSTPIIDYQYVMCCFFPPLWLVYVVNKQ